MLLGLSKDEGYGKLKHTISTLEMGFLKKACMALKY